MAKDLDETREIVYALIVTRSDFQGTLCDPPSIDVQEFVGVWRNREGAEAEGQRLVDEAGFDGPTSYDIEEGVIRD